MGYSLPQIAEVLSKTDKTLYKVGAIAYENMFSELNEALDYERDTIFIYKKAVEWADDFYVGDIRTDSIIERLSLKISIYDYGSLNPIYSGAVSITNALPGSYYLYQLGDVYISNLQNNQVLTYNSVLGKWTNAGSNSAVRSNQTFTATLNQTVFVTSSPFIAGLVDVYLNGVRLNSSSYSTFGEYTITLTDGCFADDIIDVTIYSVSTSVSPAYVPTERTLTINGVTYDLTANRSWTVEAALPSQTGNSGKYLTTNGSVASWGTIALTGYVPYTGATGAVNLGAYGITAASLIKSGGTSAQFLKADGSVDSSTYTPTTRTLTINGTTQDLSADRSWTVSSDNIYTANGTLTSARTLTSGGFPLTFTGSNTAATAIARGLNLTHTLLASANNDVLVGLDINPTFTNGAFTGVRNAGARVKTDNYNFVAEAATTGAFLTGFHARNSIGRSGFLMQGSSIDGSGHINSTVLASYDGNLNLCAGFDVSSGGSYVMKFSTGGYSMTGVERMRLTAAGRLLLGTTTESTYILDVNGTARVNGNFTSTGSYIQVPNSNGLQIGFNDGTNTPTTKSNISITNSGLGGTGYPQAFPIMTGIRNIYIVGTDGPAATGSPTISGNDNLILGNASIGNPISGSANTLIKSRGAISTGVGNTGIGSNALNGITTGSNNIHLTIGAGYGNGSFSSSLSNSVYIGDPVKTNNYTTVAGDIVITTPYTISTQFWFGGKSDATDVYFNSPAQIGTNQTGAVQYWRASIGTGSGNAGKTIFQHSTPVASGSTLHSAFTDTLTLERTKIYTPSTVNTILGSSADSGLYRLDVQGAARVTGDVRFLKTGGSSGIDICTYNTGFFTSIRHTFNAGASIGQGINFGFSTTTITAYDNNGASGSAVLGVAASNSIGVGNFVFAVTRGSDANYDPNFLFGVQGSGNVICKNGTTIRAESFSYAIGGDLNIQGGQPRGDVPNSSGGNLNVNGGLGTGTGASGDVIIATATPTSTGTTLQTLTNRVWIKGQTGNVGIGASPDAAYKLDVQGTARIKGTGTSSATTALLVQNSTGTFNCLKVRDDGKVAFGNSTTDCTITGTTGSGSKFEFYAFNGYDFQDGFGVFLLSGLGNTVRFPREVGVGSSAQNNSSAVLQADSTTKGFLPPRMTNAQRIAITSPAIGLEVYCTDTVEGKYVYKSTGWTFVI